MQSVPGPWIGLIALLFLFQTWLLPVIIQSVTSTELMRGNPDEGGSSIAVSNAQTARAFTLCNQHLAAAHPTASFTFPTAPDKSWDIGFGRYIVQTTIDVGRGPSTSELSAYVCRAHVDAGGADDGRWTVDGIELVKP